MHVLYHVINKFNTPRKEREIMSCCGGCGGAGHDEEKKETEQAETEQTNV